MIKKKKNFNDKDLWRFATTENKDFNNPNSFSHAFVNNNNNNKNSGYVKRVSRKTKQSKEEKTNKYQPWRIGSSIFFSISNFWKSFFPGLPPFEFELFAFEFS